MASSPMQMLLLSYLVFIGTYTSGPSKGIYLSRLDADGKMSPPQLVATTTNPAYLALDPRNRFLYAANEINEFHGRKNGAVSAFALDAKTGQLTFLNQQSSGGPGPCHLAVDPSGKVLLAANYDGGSIASFPIKPDGSLGPAADFIQHQGAGPNPQRQEAPHAHCILPDPAGRFVLNCDLGLDKVFLYKLDTAKATLAANDPPFAPTKPGAGPRHLAFHPGGRFVYVINEMGCSVTAFSYDAAHGSLSAIQSLPTLAPGQAQNTNWTAAEIAVHPSGKFLYGSTRGPDTLTTFRIDEATGKLSLVETVPSGGKTPRNFNLDPSGHFLLAANQNSNDIVVFSIDQGTGRLTPTGQKLNIAQPVGIVFVPAP